MGYIHGKFAGVIVHEQVEADADLPEVVFAPDTLGAEPGGR